MRDFGTQKWTIALHSHSAVSPQVVSFNQTKMANLELPFTVFYKHPRIACAFYNMAMIFPSHANKTHFHNKVVHLASFWKRGFLKLGSGRPFLKLSFLSPYSCRSFSWYSTTWKCSNVICWNSLKRCTTNEEWGNFFIKIHLQQTCSYFPGIFC